MSAELHLVTRCDHGYAEQHYWEPHGDPCADGSVVVFAPEHVVRIVDPEHDEFMLNLPLSWLINALESE